MHLHIAKFHSIAFTLFFHKIFCCHWENILRIYGLFSQQMRMVFPAMPRALPEKWEPVFG